MRQGGAKVRQVTDLAFNGRRMLPSTVELSQDHLSRMGRHSREKILASSRHVRAKRCRPGGNGSVAAAGAMVC
jgi:hypothetical protein